MAEAMPKKARRGGYPMLLSSSHKERTAQAKDFQVQKHSTYTNGCNVSAHSHGKGLRQTNLIPLRILLARESKSLVSVLSARCVATVLCLPGQGNGKQVP